MRQKTSESIWGACVLVAGFWVGLILAGPAQAGTTNYYPVFLQAEAETKVVTEEPAAVAPTITEATNPCAYTLSAGASMPGFSFEDTKIFIDEDCDARAQMYAAHIARTKAAEYMPMYQEQKERQFFREEMGKIGYVRGEDGVWHEQGVVMKMVERYFGPKVRKSDVVALGTMAAVLFIVLAGMLTWMSVNRADRDRPSGNRRHMS